MLQHKELGRTTLTSVHEVFHTEPQAPTGATEHSSVFSVNFVTAGRFTVESSSGSGPLERGAVFLTFPGLEYRTLHEPRGWDDICVSVVLREAIWLGDTPAVLRETVLPPTFRWYYLPRELQACLADDNCLALDSFAAGLATVLNQKPCEPRCFHPVAARRYADQVQAVQERSRSHPEEEHSLAELASSVGLSPFHLARIYRLMTGGTVHQALIEQRLRRAKKMLTDGATVTAACFDSGFNNLSHFIRLFGRRFGRTPSCFRNSRPAC